MFLCQPMSQGFKFKLSCKTIYQYLSYKKNHQQSLQWSVRYSPDKNSVVLGTPVGQPYSPTFLVLKVSKGAKIRNRYSQVPNLTQDTNGSVTNSQLDTTNENQEVSPFPAGDHKAKINRRAQRHSKHKTKQKHKRSTKEVRLGTVSENGAHRNPNYLSMQLGAKSKKMLSNKKVSASHTF